MRPSEGQAGKHLQASVAGASANCRVSPAADATRRAEGQRQAGQCLSVSRGGLGRAVQRCSCTSLLSVAGSEPRTCSRVGMCPAAGALDKHHLPSSPSGRTEEILTTNLLCTFSRILFSFRAMASPFLLFILSSLASYRRTFSCSSHDKHKPSFFKKKNNTTVHTHLAVLRLQREKSVLHDNSSKSRAAWTLWGQDHGRGWVPWALPSDPRVLV